VHAGKVAYLVLLAPNPLTDIRNSSRTVDVIANAKVPVIRRDTLGRLIRD
jgi:hypothetical protein